MQYLVDSLDISSVINFLREAVFVVVDANVLVWSKMANGK